MPKTPATTSKHRRRWLQFSLRTLLVLMLALGCGFGWLGYKLRQRLQKERTQREAVQAIQEWGGHVTVWEDKSQISLAFTQVTDAGLANRYGFTQLGYLDLSNTQVTDHGFNELKKELPNLWIRR